MAVQLPVLTLALPLAGVSVCFVLAFVWQVHTQAEPLERKAERMEFSCLIESAKLLRIGHLVLLAGALWVIGSSLLMGSNPILGWSSDVGWTGDVGWSALNAVSNVDLIWVLLVMAPLGWALSLLVLVAGTRAARRSRRRDAAPARSE